MGRAQRAASLIYHEHCIARLRTATVDNIARKNPKVSGFEPAGSFAVDRYPGRHLPGQQSRNAIFGARVRGEDLAEERRAGEWLDDEHVGRSRRSVHRNAL